MIDQTVLRQLIDHHRAKAEEYQARAMQCDNPVTTAFLSGQAEQHGRWARLVEDLGKARKSRLRTFLWRLVPFCFLVSWTSFGQVLIGPTNSTPTSIPTFTDATGKKLTNNTSLVWTNNLLGIRTAVPTHTVTIGSGGSGFALYNTADQTTNYRRLFVNGLGGLFAVNLNTAGTIANGILRLGNLNSNLNTTALDIAQTSYTFGIQDTNQATLDATGFQASAGVFSNSLTLPWLSNVLPRINGSGQVSGTTIGSGLSFDGVTLSANGSPGTTNYFDYTYITNLFSQSATISNLYTVNGKGNTLYITNNIQLGDYYLYPIKPGTGITFTTNASPTSGTNVTIAGPSIGTGLTLSGGVLTRDALTGDVTTSGNAATIANNAVTLPKLVNATTTQRVLGRNTAGSGNWEEVSGSGVLDWIGSTRGSILYRGASGWAALTPGTAGYALTANGAGADPTYQAIPAGGLAASASQYTIVGGAASGAANWTALSNAYVTAKSATPNGNALSALNRYTVFLLPGVYDLGSSTLTLDTQFIDVTGISPNTGVTSYNSGLGVYDYGDTVLKSSSDVVSLTANDIAIVNLALVTSGGGSVALKSAAFASQFKAINLLVYNSSALTNPGMSTDVNFNGTWTDVRCWNSKSFGGGNPTTVAGYYTHCKAGASGFVGGAFSGGAITMSATCVDCEADAQSFGGGGNRSVTLSGTFIRCRFNNATAAGGSFFGNSGNSATFSGTFIDISSEDSDSFYGTVTGIMTGCNSTVANNPLTVNGGTVLNCSLPAATITLTSGTVRNSVFANKTYNEAGTGTGTATAGGTIKVSTTTTGNVGGGEDNLITYSVPANTLTVNGDFLEFDTAGSFNNSTHNKQLKVYFGATAIFDTGSLSGATLGASSWRAHGKIIRTGAATQKATTEFTLSGALLGALTTTTTTYTTAAETLSSASTFKCTGTDLDATPANNEVVQEIEVLKWYPSN